MKECKCIVPHRVTKVSENGTYTYCKKCIGEVNREEIHPDSVYGQWMKRMNGE